MIKKRPVFLYSEIGSYNRIRFGTAILGNQDQVFLSVSIYKHELKMVILDHGIKIYTFIIIKNRETGLTPVTPRPLK